MKTLVLITSSFAACGGNILLSGIRQSLRLLLVRHFWRFIPTAHLAAIIFYPPNHPLY